MKDINIKSRTYYLFDDINIKNLDSNNIKLIKKLYKNVIIYYIEYVTIKDSKYLKVNCVNPLYFIFNKVNGYFDQNDENKYWTLVPTNKNKENNIKIWKTMH